MGKDNNLYYFLEVIESEDNDFSNYTITNERKIATTSASNTLLKEIFNLLVIKEKCDNEVRYSPVAIKDEENLGVNVYDIAEDGSLHHIETVISYYDKEGCEECFKIDFGRFGDKMMCIDYDPSENNYRILMSN